MKSKIEIDDQDPSTGELDVEEYFGEKPLRWYQVAARNMLFQSLEKGIKRILIELPTGAGKTIMIACAMGNPRIRTALGVKHNKPLRVLFVSHKHRLLSQAEATFAELSNVELIPHSMFMDIPKDLKWDVTILDESHHEACQTFQFRLDRLGGKHVIIGLTATPDRADGMLIKFEVIINPISREQCVAEGWLAPTYLNSVIDTPHSDKVPVTKLLLEKYFDQLGHTMMFYRTKKEVFEVNEYLSQRFKAKSIAILDQSNNELDDTLNRFSAGEVKFVINCNKINEGVDVKGCDTVFLGRSYGSYPQLNQVIGRAARPDSDCNVWELINPLSGKNLDTTVVVGTPERHRLISKRKGEWIEQDFDYVSGARDMDLGQQVVRRGGAVRTGRRA